MKFIALYIIHSKFPINLHMIIDLKILFKKQKGINRFQKQKAKYFHCFFFFDETSVSLFYFAYSNQLKRTPTQTSEKQSNYEKSHYFLPMNSSLGGNQTYHPVQLNNQREREVLISR